MNQTDNALSTLIDAILESDIYREYRIQRSKLHAVPELMKQVDEYRMRNYELQNSQDYAISKAEEFEREYANFRENPLVSDFLAAELALCRMMQDINRRMTEALDFE